MVCKFCGSSMIVDDVDYNFPGNKDIYWGCDNCNSTCFEKIRYGKSVFIEFCKGENNV